MGNSRIPLKQLYVKLKNEIGFSGGFTVNASIVVVWIVFGFRFSRNLDRF